MQRDGVCAVQLFLLHTTGCYNRSLVHETKKIMHVISMDNCYYMHLLPSVSKKYVMI